MDALIIPVADTVVTWTAMFLCFRAAQSKAADPRWAGQLLFAAFLLSLVGIVL